jgi:hypothetical protein
MMVLSALRPDAGLFEFLAHRARSASVRRLAIDAAVGAGAFVAALRWHHASHLVVAGAAAFLIAYGTWGLLDRGRSSLANRLGQRMAGLFDALCDLCATLGALAVAGILLAVWALAIGTWIS